MKPADMWPVDMPELKKRYCRVLGPRSEWVKYLQRPEVEPLWKLAPLQEAELTMGIACVLEKNGRDLRKVLQSVPLNVACYDVDQAFSEPFEYGLQGGAALGQLAFPVSTEEWSALTLDESNAFSHVITPEWWWPRMCGPAVRAAELPSGWTRGRWRKEEWLVPMYTRLGMGHTHSAAILLLINFRAVDIVIQANIRFQNCVLLNYRANRAR